jgi:septal ring factor EnvC (AmiA/AmiB activator)
MTDERPWLTLAEAAERTGLTKEALRSRARRGLISTRRSNSGATLVQVGTAMTAGVTTGDQALTATLTELREEIAELTTRLTKAEVERDSLAKEMDRTVTAMERSKVEAVAARDELVVELKAMLHELRQELAEARRPWWRRWFG